MTSTPTARGDGSGLVGLVVAAAVGGATGGVLRHLLGLGVAGDGVLALTLAVNVTGCLLLGLLPLLDRVGRSETWRVGVGPGLLGGFTTMSAVNEQTRSLLAEDRVGLAAGYVLGTLALGVGAAAVAARAVARNHVRRIGR